MNTESLGGKMTTDAGGGLEISLTDTGNGRGLILKDGDGLGQILLCLSHFLVDAACISLLFLPEEGRGSLLIPVLVYNTLAFVLQCPVGILMDRLTGEGSGGSVKLTGGFFAGIGMLMTALGSLLSVPFMIRVVLAGLGNSIFHVGGGIEMLKRSAGAARLGCFVAPGALGVALGSVMPQAGPYISILLILFGVFFILRGRAAGESSGVSCTGGQETGKDGDHGYASGKCRMGVVLALACAVAVRAMGGTAVDFPWKKGAQMALLMAAFVFLGKLLGGFFCDRVGVRLSAVVSIVPAAVLTAFFAEYMAPSLAGQLLLNLSMPLTLYLMYRELPNDPGFAFGLAAAALWPGTLVGYLFHFTGSMLRVCVILSFMFGLAAIFYAIKDALPEGRNYEKNGT